MLILLEVVFLGSTLIRCNPWWLAGSLTSAPVHDDLTLGGAELEEVKSPRLLGVTLDSKLTFETHLGKLCQRQPGIWGSFAKQECYLIVHVSQGLFQCISFVQLGVLCSRVDVRVEHPMNDYLKLFLQLVILEFLF